MLLVRAMPLIMDSCFVLAILLNVCLLAINSELPEINPFLHAILENYFIFPLEFIFMILSSVRLVSFVAKQFPKWVPSDEEAEEEAAEEAVEESAPSAFQAVKPLLAVVSGVYDRTLAVLKLTAACVPGSEPEQFISILIYRWCCTPRHLPLAHFTLTPPIPRCPASPSPLLVACNPRTPRARGSWTSGGS